nr:DUF4355 domain-containing protein [uncultured Clostridium sp.]
MKKSELLKLIEQLDDNASVDEVLSQTDFAKSVLKGGLTLDAFKEKLTEDKTFKSFMDSEKDKHYQKALETWKANNLQPIIDDAVLKATGKKKTPLELKVEELERKNAEAEARANELARQGKINALLSEKGLNQELTKYLKFEGDDEAIATSMDNFKAFLEDMVNEGVKSEIDKGVYVPPGSSGTDGNELLEIEKYMGI